MKRIVSLMMALMMIFTCTAALADDFGISIEDYLEYANLLNNGLGMQVDWIDRSEDRDYASMQGIFQSLSNNNSVHLYCDPILAVECVYTMPMDADNEAFQLFGDEFGQMAASGVITAWVVQHMHDEDFQQQMEMMNAMLPDEMNELLAPMMAMDSSYSGEMLRQEGTFCGIPAVFELETDMENKLFILYLMVTPDATMLINY